MALKKWVAKKLIKLIRVEWSQSAILGDLEVQIFLDCRNLLLLKGRPDYYTITPGRGWIWEELDGDN